MGIPLYPANILQLDNNRNLQTRDGYLSAIKARIENMVARYGEKVIVMSHSYGGIVFFYFMKCVRGGVRYCVHERYCFMKCVGVGVRYGCMKCVDVGVRYCFMKCG